MSSSIGVWLLTILAYGPLLLLVSALRLGRLPLPPDIAPGIVSWLPWFAGLSALAMGLRGLLRFLAEGERDVSGNLYNALLGGIAAPGLLLALVAFNAVMLHSNWVDSALLGLSLFVILNIAVGIAPWVAPARVGRQTPGFVRFTGAVTFAFQATLRWGAELSQRNIFNLSRTANDLLGVAIFFVMIFGLAGLLMKLNELLSHFIERRAQRHAYGTRLVVAALAGSHVLLGWLCFAR